MNRWPLGVAVALAGAVSLNVAMLAIAAGNRPVLETETAWVDGLDHQRLIDERRASAALGWRVDVATAEGRLAVTARDGAGRPLRLRGEAQLTRADEARGDRTVEVVTSAEGEAAVPLADARAGVWRLRMRLAGEGGTWVDERRVVLP